MRHLSTLALAGLFGGLLLVGDASACHKKKCHCPAPVTVVCTPPPVCPPPVCVTYVPVCAPKVKHQFKLFCHKKTAPVCVTYAPVTYAPVSYATPQSYPSGQGM